MFKIAKSQPRGTSGCNLLRGPLDGRPACWTDDRVCDENSNTTGTVAAALRVICRKYRGLCSGGSALLVFLLLLTHHASCYSCVSDM